MVFVTQYIMDCKYYSITALYSVKWQHTILSFYYIKIYLTKSKCILVADFSCFNYCCNDNSLYTSLMVPCRDIGAWDMLHSKSFDISNIKLTSRNSKLRYMLPFLHISHFVYQNKKWLFDQPSSSSLSVSGISVKKHSVGGCSTCMPFVGSALPSGKDTLFNRHVHWNSSWYMIWVNYCHHPSSPWHGFCLDKQI